MPGWKILLLALGAAAPIALVLTTAIPPQSRFLALLNNAGHAPLFGAFAWLVLRIVGTMGRGGTLRASHYLAVFAATVVLGALVELIQYHMGRSASATDLLMDAAGATFALCLSALRHRPATDRQRRFRLGLLAGALASVAVVAAPLAHATLAYARRDAIFPDLIRFERRTDYYFLENRGVRTRADLLPEIDAPLLGIAERPGLTGAGLRGLRVELLRDHTPGLRLIEPEPDWRGYRVLKVGIINTGDSRLRLVVRVHDALHDQRHGDRFNRSFTIEARSVRVLEVPVGDIEDAPRERKLDLARVAGVGIFESSRPAPVGAVFYLTGIWLE